MKNSQKIIEISETIEQFAPDLSDGKETIDSIIEQYPQYATELRPRLEAMQMLASIKPGLEPRPGFIASSRNYIESRAVTRPQKDVWHRILNRYTPQHWAFYITAPALIIVLLALIFNSLVLTARMALPGDTLYSTKILMEDLRMALTFDREKKADLYIQYTRERSSEMVDLVLDGDYEALTITASRFETDLIDSLHSLNALYQDNPEIVLPKSAELRNTLTGELFMLNVLKSSAPASAYPGIDMAMNVAQSGILALR